MVQSSDTPVKPIVRNATQEQLDNHQPSQSSTIMYCTGGNEMPLSHVYLAAT